MFYFKCHKKQFAPDKDIPYPGRINKKGVNLIF